MPSTVVQIQGLHYSTSRPTQLMPNFPLPPPHRYCTTTSYLPPYHLRSTILMQQPYRFKSTLRIELSMPSPMMISTPSNLHHSLLVSTWPHLTPWGKYGYLLKKFVSSPRTATKYALPKGTIYCHTRSHFCECSVKCNDAKPEAPSAKSETGSHQVSQTCATTCHNHSMITAISCTCDPRNQTLLSQFLHLQPCWRSPQCLHPPLHQV